MAKVTWTVANVEKTIAYLPEVRAVVRAEAYAGGARARAKLKGHTHGKTLRHSKITVTKGDKLDWFVNLDDADGGAAAIEYGRRGSPGGHFITGVW